jgi:hypothetical protein
MQFLVSLMDDLAHGVMARAHDNGCSFDEQIANDVRRAAALSVSVTTPPVAPPLMTFEAAMELGLARAAARSSGAVFEFEDLYLPAEWPLVPNTRSCGRSFRKRVTSGQIATFIGRSESRHARYRRN